MWFGLTRSTELTGSTQSTRVNPVDSVNWLTQSRSTQSNGQRLDAKIGCIFKIMARLIQEPCGFEYLVGVRFLEVLALTTSIVQ
ncbi:hypothetical protein HanHA300_Chr01g0004951 [Helianthus annuus]|nr:hypothetical protein HanHA300_Chr01g0004951 [Helianthus annuus]KAJ0625793.1 hypothetical protein HanHA89_Chr01g0005621 [Helianthus annuus]KAJ0782155.1 hypothetical protein HanLR1_Chr01g0004891 [Helianthus annuus]